MRLKSSMRHTVHPPDTTCQPIRYKKSLTGVSHSCILSVDSTFGGRMPDYKAFGVWLKATREDRELSQEALAKLIGKKKAYISKLETATPHSTTNTPPTPSIDTLARLVRVLNVSFTDPLRAYGFIKEGPAFFNERETRAVNHLRQLPAGYADLFLDFLALAAGRYTRPDDIERPGTGTDDQ